MQNKRPIYLGIIFAIVVVTIITVVLLNIEPAENEYIFWDSADKATCEAKKTTLASQGWTCYSCTDSDNDLKYSLYCDQPTCVDGCDGKAIGSYDCNGLVNFKCVASGDCDKKWEQIGYVVEKCGVECKITSDCETGQTCENYKCIGEIIVDPCESVTCPATFCSGTVYNYGGTCSNGDCVYSQTECMSQEICVEAQGCMYTPQCTKDLDCPEGNKCVGTSCSPIEGYCKVDEACNEGYYCNLTKNLCEKQTNVLPFAIGGTLLLGSIVVLLAKRKK